MAADINELKQKVFYDLMNLAGRVFVLVRHADDVHIGNRGFLPEEKEKGLVLVFNNKMNFSWDEAGISARLVFGSSPQRCFIPSESIISVFSPELSAQFVTSSAEKKQTERETALSKPKDENAEQSVPEQPRKKSDVGSSCKVFEVDFRKKR